MSTRAIAATTQPIRVASSSRREARRLSHHQARTAASLGDRARDRTHEDRRPPRPLPSQGSATPQRHTHRRQPRSSPCSRLAEGFAAPDPDRSMAGIHRRPSSQMGLLDADQTRKPQFYRAVEDISKKCQPAKLASANLMWIVRRFAEATSQAALQMVLDRVRRFSTDDES